MATEEGIFTGVTSVLHVVAAIQSGLVLGNDYTVVTVACDAGMKYLSSGLLE